LCSSQCIFLGVRLIVVLVRVALAVCGLGLALPACGTTELHFRDADAGTEPDANLGGECAAESTCVQVPNNWDGPTLMWKGPHAMLFDPDGAPSCPYGGEYAFRGGLDLVAPTDCMPCTCGPSTGSCELPSKMTAHDVICQDLGKPHNDIPFDATSGWKGGCDAMDPIAAGSGVQSLSIEPLTIKQEWCAVGPPVPARKLAEPYWTTDAFACHVEGYWECNGDRVARCIPNERPAGFHVCITIAGNVKCDYSPWTETYFFYGGVNDQRGCSDCSCGWPVGSDCEAMISVYNDNLCQAGQTSNNVTSAPAFCTNVPPGVALGSKSSTPPVYISGVCLPSGGVPDGGIAEPILPTTFCCLP
jgi:hypothetical protein